MRKFVDEIIYPDAQAREEDGKRPSQSVLDAMTWVPDPCEPEQPLSAISVRRISMRCALAPASTSRASH